jgi:hypothetical protein
MSEITWTTEKRFLGDLKLHNTNPRVLTEKARVELSESLDRFDLGEIPAINTDNTIIAGNQRVTLLLEKKGPKHEIDVRVPSRKLTDKECKEYLLRSNKNTGDWDFDILMQDFDFDMLLDVGFTADDIKDPAVKKEKDKELDFSVKGMDMKSFESYDYVLVMFDNLSDYINFCTKIGIEEKVEVNMRNNVRKTGYGRAIYGKDIIDRII